MAKLGFEYVVAAIFDEDKKQYSGGKYMGESATFNVTVTANDVKDYGDNRAVLTDTSVTGGTVSIELLDMAEELGSFLLGHEYDAETQKMVCKKDDIAPYVGLGAVGISKKAGFRYVAKLYKKVQFKEPNDENATQTDTVTPGHTTIEGNMFVPEDGIWKEQQTFDTLQEAKEWLNGQLGIKTEGSGGTEGTEEAGSSEESETGEQVTA